MKKPIDYYKKAVYQLDALVQKTTPISKDLDVVDFTYIALNELGINGVGVFAGKNNQLSHVQSGLTLDGSKRVEPYIVLSQPVIEHNAYWIAIHEIGHLLHSFVVPYDIYISNRVHGRCFLALHKAIIDFLCPDYISSFVAACKQVSGRMLPRWIPEVEINHFEFKDDLNCMTDTSYQLVKVLSPDECLVSQYESDEDIVTIFERDGGDFVVITVSKVCDVSLW